MADVGIYTKSADIIAKAGTGVNATAVSVAETDKYVLFVEALINCTTRFDWSTWMTAVETAVTHAAVKDLITEASSSLCAIKVINYGGYTFGLAEAQTRMSVLWDDFNRAIKLLGDKKVQDFMEATS